MMKILRAIRTWLTTPEPETTLVNWLRRPKASPSSSENSTEATIQEQQPATEAASAITEPSPGAESESKPAALQTFEFEIVTVEADGQERERRRGQAQYFVETLAQNEQLEMVAIPGGSCLMGSPETELGRWECEGPQHSVTVAPFFLGKYPVTQAQWMAVMDNNPSCFQGGNRPVEQIFWHEATEFCQKLAKMTGRPYRLPSEAEWEYACRAGTTTPFHFGETITTRLANYDGYSVYGSGPKGEYREQTTPVGRFQIANAFGLFDMHGNVWEWCADHWHRNYEGAPTDGQAWLYEQEYTARVLRGGSWFSSPRLNRSASRKHEIRSERRERYCGFRVACSAL